MTWCSRASAQSIARYGVFVAAHRGFGDDFWSYPRMVDERTRRALLLARKHELGPSERGPFSDRPDGPKVIGGILNSSEDADGDLVIYGNLRGLPGRLSLIHFQAGRARGPSADEIQTFIIRPEAVALPTELTPPRYYATLPGLPGWGAARRRQTLDITAHTVGAPSYFRHGGFRVAARRKITGTGPRLD
jgi:hypothetical protein